MNTLLGAIGTSKQKDEKWLTSYIIMNIGYLSRQTVKPLYSDAMEGSSVTIESVLELLMFLSHEATRQVLPIRSIRRIKLFVSDRVALSILTGKRKIPEGVRVNMKAIRSVIRDPGFIPTVDYEYVLPNENPAFASLEELETYAKQAEKMLKNVLGMEEKKNGKKDSNF